MLGRPPVLTYGLAAILIIAAFLIFRPGASTSDTGSDSTLYAKVYVKGVDGTTKALELPFLGLKPLAKLTVGGVVFYDSKLPLQDGEIFFEPHAKITIKTGTPTAWLIQLTSSITKDVNTFRSTTMQKSGLGAPAPDIAIGQHRVKGSEVAAFLGTVPLVATPHDLSYNIVGTIKVDFKEGPSSTVAFTKLGLAKTTVSYAPDTGSFSVELSASTTGGTTTDPTPTTLASSPTTTFKCATDPTYGTWEFHVTSATRSVFNLGVVLSQTAGSNPVRTDSTGLACQLSYDTTGGIAYGATVFTIEAGFRQDLTSASIVSPPPGKVSVITIPVT